MTSSLLKQLGGYIATQWVQADSGETFPVSNPATGETLAQVPKLGAGETQRAIAAAKDAMTEFVPVGTRMEWLEAIHSLLLDNKTDIARILTAEHGKPLDQAEAEVQYAAGFFAHYGATLDELEPRHIKHDPKECHWTVYPRPIGVVGLISPWNFPIAMMAKKLSAALAAGCSCVIKPSSKTPLTMIAFVQLLAKKLPACAKRVQLVVGGASDIGGALCESPAVAMISFTGSTSVGQTLMAQCAPSIKKLALELGGNAPFIVYPDADLDLAVNELVTNKTRGSGQTCVCANRVLVHSAVADDFVEKLGDALAEVKVGDGTEKGVAIGPLIDKDAYQKVRGLLQDALDQGANLVFGEDPGALDKDWGGFFPPVVLTAIKPTMQCVSEEIFGPLFPVMTFDNDEAALNLANDTDAGLSAYLFTEDATRIPELLAGLHFGHVGVNTATGPTPEAPFGGMKTSGIGREGGIEGLFEFIEPQTVAKKKDS